MRIFSSILDSVGIPSNSVNNVIISGNDPILSSPFLIGEAGAAAIAAVGFLASELWNLKTHGRQQIEISVRNAAIVQRSHDYLKIINGEKLELWNPISGFYRTQDQRWIQLHCNFPEHLNGILALLNCENNKAAVAQAIRNWQADTLEEKSAQHGLCTAIMRTAEEWQVHPQAQAIQTLPLLEVIKIHDSQPEALPVGKRPLTDIKVLDLTRVIAGPICGRTLAEHGATVMLISSPNLPFIAPLVMDTGHGKLSAYLDLNKNEAKEQLKKLIRQTDIFIQSYRPGGLAKLGFSPAAVAQIRPGIIYVSLSAYSHVGPWANRHGFDSLVQCATGIAEEQTHYKKTHQNGNTKNITQLSVSDSEIPQHLPAQSLDYITGFLAAFGAMEALRRRALHGGSYLVRVSLAQTAQWFKQVGRASLNHFQDEIPQREQINNLLTQRNTLFGRLEYLLPVLKMSETPPQWELPTVPLGTHPPKW